jgi:flagellar biosynthesis protein FliQ
MSDADVVEVGRDAMMAVLVISAPLLLAALVVGLVIAVFQALTSIQEMTLTFVPKIIIVFVALVVFLPFMIRTLVEFSHQLFDRMIGLGAG